jgi:hypothetical protein
MPGSPSGVMTVPPAASLPQPQTTLEPPGGPFVRYAQRGRKSMYVLSAQPLTAYVTQPLVATPGYLRNYRLRFQTSGGTGTAAVNAADGPYNLISQLIFRDAYGVPLISGSGYEMLKLVPKYSSQLGLLLGSDPSNLPSWTAMANTGNGAFATGLPLEFSKAYGVIAGANAAAVPTLTMQLANALFSTQPTAAPTVEIDLDTDFYWLPGSNQILPPGFGTTCQWMQQQGSPTIGSQSAVTVQVPRMGGYIHTIILELRDSTNARVDAWPTRLQITIDGVPYIDSRTEQLYDDMYQQYGGITRETGVLAITRKNSLSQLSLGLLDTMEEAISTNPGTQLTVTGSPWGTISNAPATLTVIVGQIVPAGMILQGIPEI